MAETIEEFVARIQTDGVEAGQKQADQLLATARAQAEQVLADARAQGDRILADARAAAAAEKDRSQTELRLAARDTVLKLRRTLVHAVERVLAQAAEAKLTDKDFVADAIQRLVEAYSAADAGAATARVAVAPELQKQLADWALQQVARPGEPPAKGGFDLVGTLREAGFEYRIGGSAVEVTQNSVVEALKELVSPRIREILDQASGESKE